MSTGHGHDHHPRRDSELALRARALEALLAEKGLVATDAIDAVVELYERDVGPQNGARVVAHAWTDPAYRERLLADGHAGCTAEACLHWGLRRGEVYLDPLSLLRPPRVRLLPWH